MEQNLLVKKTNELIRNQNELSNTLQDLRAEVIKSGERNKLLAIENMKLRKELHELKSMAESNKINETIKEKPHTIIDENIPVPSVKQVVTEVKEEETESKIITKHREKLSDVTYDEKQIVYKDYSIQKDSIYEFFLGKNVIAKIAAIMISLGIFTFGRMAYTWMTDIGKFFFILIIGLVFFVVGYLFDRKKSKVFSTTFYGIALVTLLISMFIGGFTLGIIDPVLYAILNFMMIGAVFIFFRNKHQMLLETLLSLFYVTLVIFTNVTAFSEPSAIIKVFGTISIISVSLIFAYRLLVTYKDNEIKLLLPYISFMSVLTTYQLAFLTEEQSYNIIWGLCVILLTYIGNYVMFNKIKQFNFLIGIQTIISIVISVITAYFTLSVNGGLTEGFLLISFLVFIPIYVYLYKDEIDGRIRTIDVYAFFMTILILVYGLVYGISDSVLSFEGIAVIRNIIILLTLIASYFISRNSERQTHENMFKMISTVFIVNILVIILEADMISFEFAGVYITNVLALIGLVTIDTIFNKRTNQFNLKLSYILQGLLLVVLPMSMLMISRELIDIVSPRYSIFYWTSLVYYIVLYKEVFTNKYFIAEKSRLYRNIVNILILFGTILVNFIYFDHNFSNGIDVFTFIFVMIPNLYIMYSLRELYLYAVDKIDIEDEWIFIILFKTGVIIQSLFIHYYINFTYDKVLLSSYFMIVAAIGVLFGFKSGWKKARYIGLAAIYFSFIKFFVYDFFKQDLTDSVKVVTYITLGVVLMGISFLYSRLEKTYGGNEVL